MAPRTEKVTAERRATKPATLRRPHVRRLGPTVRDAILEAAERCSALPDLDTRTADEILGYDERGSFDTCSPAPRGDAGDQDPTVGAPSTPSSDRPPRTG